MVNDVLYEPSLERAAEQGRAGPTLTKIRAILQVIDEHARKVAIAGAVIRRLCEEDRPLKPLRTRPAKRAVVWFAINAGHSDSEIRRRLGVSRDLVRDVRRNSSSSRASRDKK
jgi:hypothetical protein